MAEGKLAERLQVTALGNSAMGICQHLKCVIALAEHFENKKGGDLKIVSDSLITNAF